MKDETLEKLFRAASAEPAAEPAAGFAPRVLAAVRREGRPRAVPFFEQLGELLPRVAVAAGLAVILCVGTDFCLAQFGRSDLSAGIAEASEQWFFAGR